MRKFGGTIFFCCCCYFYHFVLAINNFVVVVSSAKAARDSSFPLVIVPIIQHPSDDTNTSRTNVTILDYLPRKGYLASTDDDFSVIAPYQNGSSSSHPSVAVRGKKKELLRKTSYQAGQHDCRVAINGGPYHGDGTSVGAVLSHGELVSNARFDGRGVGFGRTKDGTDWIVGSVSSWKQARGMSLWDFVTGFGWLVYQGKSVANNSDNPTDAFRAPRTAIGVKPRGRLLLLVVDGCKRCIRRRGLTLEELGSAMVTLGAEYAVNLDGGSSSTFVIDSGRVLNNPTCLGIPFRCQAAVRSVVCITKKQKLAHIEEASMVE